jgi:hypothetical protein
VLPVLLMTVPRFFTIRWVLWYDIKPDTFELPPVLHKYSIYDEDNDNLTFRPIDDDGERVSDRTVARALEFIYQSLVLFFWAAQKEKNLFGVLTQFPTGLHLY